MTNTRLVPADHIFRWVRPEPHTEGVFQVVHALLTVHSSVTVQQVEAMIRRLHREQVFVSVVSEEGGRTVLQIRSVPWVSEMIEGFLFMLYPHIGSVETVTREIGSGALSEALGLLERPITTGATASITMVGLPPHLVPVIAKVQQVTGTVNPDSSATFTGTLTDISDLSDYLINGDRGW